MHIKHDAQNLPCSLKLHPVILITEFEISTVQANNTSLTNIFYLLIIKLFKWTTVQGKYKQAKTRK